MSGGARDGAVSVACGGGLGRPCSARSPPCPLMHAAARTRPDLVGCCGSPLGISTHIFKDQAQTYIFGCTVLVLREKDDRGVHGSLDKGRTYMARYLTLGVMALGTASRNWTLGQFATHGTAHQSMSTSLFVTPFLRPRHCTQCSHRP